MSAGKGEIEQKLDKFIEKAYEGAGKDASSPDPKQNSLTKSEV